MEQIIDILQKQADALADGTRNMALLTEEMSARQIVAIDVVEKISEDISVYYQQEDLANRISTIDDILIVKT